MDFLQLDVLEEKYVKFGTEKMVSLTCFENISQTHARVPYSLSGLMVVHFESVRLKKMSMTLNNLVEMMSPTCNNSSMASILFCIFDFFTIGGSEKGVCEAEYRKEGSGQGD